MTYFYKAVELPEDIQSLLPPEISNIFEIHEVRWELGDLMTMDTTLQGKMLHVVLVPPEEGDTKLVISYYVPGDPEWRQLEPGEEFESFCGGVSGEAIQECLLRLYLQLFEWVALKVF